MEKIMPLKAGTKIDLPPKEKYELDRDDKAQVKKASFKQKPKDISKSKKTKPVKSKAGKTKSVKTALLKQKKDKA
jgi:hypothetical protein